jgi:hypothetical protein
MSIKACRECGMEVSSGAKNCPHCGIDQRNWFIRHKIITAILVVIALVILSSLGGDDAEKEPKTANNKQVTEASGKAQEKEEVKEPPMVVSAKKLLEDLENNALQASNTYKGKYVEVTGRLGSIDSGGDYFILEPGGDYFTFITSVSCDISEEHLDAVANLKKGQQLTVVGTVTSVGEVMGYDIEVESIK